MQFNISDDRHIIRAQCSLLMLIIRPGIGLSALIEDSSKLWKENKKEWVMGLKKLSFNVPPEGARSQVGCTFWLAVNAQQDNS